MEQKNLDQSVQCLKGMGPAKAQMLSRLGVTSLREMLTLFPREYDDRRLIQRIGTAPANTRVTVKGKVETAEVMALSPTLKIFKVAVSDSSGICYAQFFRHVNPYQRFDIFASLKSSFVPGQWVILNGIMEYRFRERQLSVDDHALLASADAPLPASFNGIIPIYPLTEGISQKFLRGMMTKAVSSYAKEWPELLPETMCEELKLPGAAKAVRSIHFPASFQEAESARKRLAADEFYLLEAAMTLVRERSQRQTKPRSYEVKKHLLGQFRVKMGFEFTRAQKRSINEIFCDMQKTAPMNRLLTGDVGSGKTVVALSAALLAIENGFQAALLAPTEILASQHAVSISNLLEGLPVNIALVTGNLSASGAGRAALRKAVADGSAQLVIGTHALLDENVSFKNLGLVVIDEQHRFGVLQRAALQKKASMPDVLIMTATPIPRSLALTLYGDLDVSVIDTLPPGRLPVITKHVADHEAYSFIKSEIAKKHQAFIVYPLVDSTDSSEMKAAASEAANLSKTIFFGLHVGLLHGQMKAADKDAVMKGFRDGTFDILIATTVIEVGIDVPNATVMMIEHCERFGLATLHQLRGRVGRGKSQSYCLLAGQPSTEQAKRRIDVMLSTTDGFKIAQEDLVLRGPGEFFGTAQHGMPELKAGNIITDLDLIKTAKEAAEKTLSTDHTLALSENRQLRDELTRVFGGKISLATI